MGGFEQDTYELDGWQLERLAPVQADDLARKVVKIDPWKTLGSKHGNLSPFLLKRGPDVTSWGIFSNNVVAGAISIKPNWLLGPYLGFIAILPQFQRSGLGKQIMNWMEQEARLSRARNLFLCVSGFNTQAQDFYHHLGFGVAAELDELVVDDHDEILMRKRLQY